MNNLIQFSILKKLWMPFLVGMLIFILPAEAQEMPPRPITVKVSTLQHLNFGSIIPTSDSGGTVTIASNGGLTSSGDILLIGLSHSPALFLVDAEPGTLININYNSNNSTINISNGGNHLVLTLGIPSTGSPFITRSQTTDVFIGGTLTVGSIGANPAGNYNGTFQVTFIQQ